jgi:S-DNA-T family DNA segregation ATPase FtsK/SpoIIIE
MGFDLSIALRNVASFVKDTAVSMVTGWTPVVDAGLVSPTLADLPTDGGKDALWFVLGKTSKGVTRYECLENMPHLLVAGTTGSGKSVFLDMLLASLLVHHSPSTLRLGLVDKARVSFRKYRSLPHLMGEVRCDIESAYDLVHECTKEMERRLDLFGDMEKLSEYNKVARESLPRWVIVIDEFAYLLASAKKAKETKGIAMRFEAEMNDLAAVARKTGIHLVLCTQKPLATIVDSIMKSNFPSRVSFQVTCSSDSRVILDEVGAERLTGKGDMLFKSVSDPDLEHMRGVYIGKEELDLAIRGSYGKSRVHV